MSQFKEKSLGALRVYSQLGTDPGPAPGSHSESLLSLGVPFCSSGGKKSLRSDETLSVLEIFE